MATITGTSGNDPLSGTPGDDIIYGLEGDDTINAGTGSDRIDGGAGDDIITLTYVRGDGSDTIEGGAGIDTLVIDVSTANEAQGFGPQPYALGLPGYTITLFNFEQFHITGTSRDDVLVGGIGNDILNGFGGNDKLVSNGGVDTLIGGDGIDSVQIDFSTTFENQNVTNVGKSGLTNGTTFEQIEAFDLKTGSGNDVINFVGNYDDTIATTAGNDLVNAGGGDDNVDGGADNDTLNGGTGNDTLAGDDGNDVLSGGTGYDRLDGGMGDDVLTLTYSPNDPGAYVEGGAGFDTLIINVFAANQAQGIGPQPYALGLPGYTITNFDIEQFYITGTIRDDNLPGGIGNDILNGIAGNDTITGNEGNDQLTGGGGKDSIKGGIGNDTISGGAGKDMLEGDAGKDFFVFDIGKPFKRSIGVDTIVDFERSDKIVLNKTTFKALKGKKVSFASVKSITQAQKSTALITYIRLTGALYYNQNGKENGFGKGQQFADLSDGFKLTASNVIVRA